MAWTRLELLAAAAASIVLFTLLFAGRSCVPANAATSAAAATILVGEVRIHGMDIPLTTFRSKVPPKVSVVQVSSVDPSSSLQGTQYQVETFNIDGEVTSVLQTNGDYFVTWHFVER